MKELHLNFLVYNFFGIFGTFQRISRSWRQQVTQAKLCKSPIHSTTSFCLVGRVFSMFVGALEPPWHLLSCKKMNLCKRRKILIYGDRRNHVCSVPTSRLPLLIFSPFRQPCLSSPRNKEQRLPNCGLRATPRLPRSERCRGCWNELYTDLAGNCSNIRICAFFNSDFQCKRCTVAKNSVHDISNFFIVKFSIQRFECDQNEWKSSLEPRERSIQSWKEKYFQTVFLAENFQEFFCPNCSYLLVWRVIHLKFQQLSS